MTASVAPVAGDENSQPNTSIYDRPRRQSAKRKAANDDEDQQEEEVTKRTTLAEFSDSSDAEEEEEDEAFDNARRASRGTGSRKRQRSSLARPAPLTPTIQRSAQRATSPFTQPSTSSSSGSGEITTHLYDMFLACTSVTEKMWKDWYARYQQDGLSACGELAVLFLRCCCLKETPLTLAHMTDVDEIENHLQDLLDANDLSLAADDLVLYGRSKEAKRLKRNLFAFLRRLLVFANAQHVLADGLLLSQVQSWLIAMTTSNWRPMRHAATMMALNVLQALSEVGAQLETTLQKLDEQSLRSSERLKKNKTLQEKKEQAEAQKDAVDDCLQDFHDNMFSHRYRDVDAHIRTECIQVLGACILQYPSFWLEDVYLRYLGWLLSDKAASVRFASLTALYTLYQVEGFKDALVLFTNRFQPRMLEMASSDMDVAGRARGIQTVAAMTTVGFLDGALALPFAKALFDSAPKMKQAAAQLVFELAKKGPGHVVSNLLEVILALAPHLPKQKNVWQRGSATVLPSLEPVQRVVTEGAAPLSKYFTDLRDHEAILSLLVQERLSLSTENAEQCDALLLLFLKDMLHERDGEAKESMSRAIVPHLNHFVTKYATSMTCLPPLFLVISKLAFDVYSESEALPRFTALLEEMNRLFLRFEEPTILNGIMQVYHQAITSSPHLKSSATARLITVTTDCVMQLRGALHGEEQSDLKRYLARLAAIVRFVDMEELAGVGMTHRELFHLLTEKLSALTSAVMSSSDAAAHYRAGLPILYATLLYAWRAETSTLDEGWVPALHSFWAMLMTVGQASIAQLATEDEASKTLCLETMACAGDYAGVLRACTLRLPTLDLGQIRNGLDARVAEVETYFSSLLHRHEVAAAAETMEEERREMQHVDEADRDAIVDALLVSFYRTAYHSGLGAARVASLLKLGYKKWSETVDRLCDAFYNESRLMRELEAPEADAWRQMMANTD